MIIASLVLLLAAQQPGDSSAYLDPTARRLVAAARARRETVDRSITAYNVTMRERIGAGVRALRRDRMLYRRELALHIEWRRDSVGRIEVIGARQAIPAVRPRVELPEDLQGDVADYAFDPAADGITVGFGGGDRDRDGEGKGMRLGHPLAPGSEANYRFATGDSSVLVFPDGRTIVLRELRVIPRRLDFQLMTGSLWIDEATHGVVRALFKPARPFDFEEDVGDEDKDIPGFAKPIRGEVRFITIDYGLWAGRWWLPRLIAFDAVATAGSWLQMPLRYERLYSDYEVTGDTTLRRAPRPPRATEAEDSTAWAQCHSQVDTLTVQCRCRNGECLKFAVHIPIDTAALLASAELPPAYTGPGDTLISAGEIQDLMHGLGRLPQAPWQFRARPPRWGLARFNRVEGLSLGAKGELDLGRLVLDGSARVALADGEPDVEGGVTRETRTARMRLAGYRRLNAVDAAGGSNALGFGNSLSSLLFGRDDGDYYRSAGIGVTVLPAVTAQQTFSVRVYAERQRSAAKRTDFSLPHVLHADHVFRPNVIADSADQLGAELTLRAQRGFDPGKPRWSADLSLDGGAGTYGFGRGSFVLRTTTPLTPQVTGAIEVAGGTSAGRVPVQSRWYLGGPNTLRGYAGGVMSGDAYWRARGEIANSWPAARVALFCDVGRAAPRDRLSLAHPLVGVGVGASFLDGLLRIDLGRALKSPKGWRLDFYMDGVL
ncbi:MAG TPA: hypothetical protein VGQ18_10780 [Gemmatimonadales bacterium]|nr:hypothetical protein [Gemmatimonadales bacterium]